ncbi:MAG: ParB/RepB/Spo0J family partition protein [Candidatus Kryptoniota bacterium]
MKSNIRLGRGLDALIRKDSTSFDKTIQSGTSRLSVDSVVKIPVRDIRANKFQPRKQFHRESLEELKDSIKENGLVQPVTVRRIDGGLFELISGERRLRAVNELGIKDIPAYVLQVDSDAKMLELALTENLQREDLNPIEIALGYQRLIDECDLTQEQVARKVGKDRVTVTNSLRLLKLPAQIQKSITAGEISEGHARALVAIENQKELFRLFDKTVRNSLSVRQVENEVRQLLGKSKTKSPRTNDSKIPGRNGTNNNSVISDIIDKLRKHLGTQVKINYSDTHKGEIKIEFYTDDDLERLIELILGDRRE